MPRSLRVDVLATLPHYGHHLRPVWDALPEERRGDWLHSAPPGGGRDPSRPLLVAGFADAARIPGRRVIVLEHGAGQSYRGDPLAAGHGSYAGGDGWDHAIGFLCPSETVADRWRARYPAATVEVVGCPRLDQFHGVAPVRSTRPIVAFTWHWECGFIPETRSAIEHYRHALPEQVRQLRDVYGFSVVGHSHPRWRGALAARYRELDIPIVSTLDEVLATASVLVADNTSALYEFAALDRPVVVLNAPWYRRDVEHGLRFWSHVPGIQVDAPDQVAYATALALTDSPVFHEQRRAAVAHTYAHLDGGASQRAASAILRMLDG